jgi:PPK2 family polyphosphate:nucleotide phosphotransferase
MAWEQFRMESGTAARLNDRDTAETDGVTEKQAEKRLAKAADQLAALQDILMADGSWAVLLVFQAMDASGKDGAIRNLFAAADPQGCRAYQFKEPSAEENRHDYLWRSVRRLPERGQIVAFNRSYYEEVTSTRVYPERLEEQKLPPHLRDTPEIWERRFRQINAFEQHLTENGTLVLKFYLHASHEGQREHLLDRLSRPEKQWKFSSSDMEDRAQWEKFMAAYEEALTRTNTAHAPWYIVPTDQPWFSRMVVAEAVVSVLEGLGLAYPEPTKEEREEMKQAEKKLKEEEG